MSNLTQAERDKLDESFFGDPKNRLFPIKDQDDVNSASHLIGKAENPAAVRKRIIAICKREGYDIPDAWKEDAKGVNGLEYKSFSAFDVKSVDQESGIIEAIVSVFNNVDQGHDRILPGFFTKSLRTKLPKGVWMHDWSKPVAKTLEARELSPGSPGLPDAIRMLGGLYIKGQFNLDTQRGREAFSDLVFGTVDEFSIGYQTSKDRVDGKTGVRDLIEGNLYEWSPVLIGMNKSTSLLSTKDADMDPDAAATDPVDPDPIPAPNPIVDPASKALSEGSDDQGGATVDADDGTDADDSDDDDAPDVPEAGDHVKWGAYTKGMAAGCGTVKSVHVVGPIAGLDASKAAPVIATYKCKSVKPPAGDADEVETKAGGVCQMTKSLAYHPAAKVKPKRGMALPMPDDDPADDGGDDGDTDDDSKAHATKGSCLGDTDEMMACAALDKLLSALGYFLFSAIRNDDPVAKVVANAGLAVDEFKATLTSLLSSILIDNDPEDESGPTPVDMVSSPGGPYSPYGYGMNAAPIGLYTLKFLADLASLDTSRDRAVAALSLEKSSNGLVSDAGEILNGFRRHFAVRTKEGRTLSGATRQRIKAVLEGITPLVTDLQALLAETEPKPKDAPETVGGSPRAKANAASILAARVEFARHEFLATQGA